MTRSERVDHSGKTDEAVLLRPIAETGKGFYVTAFILTAIVAWAAAAFVWQCIYGLEVTGMNRPVYWGFYIINFVFFIGISHAGTLISAILRVCQAEWRRPITRVAEAITVFALFIGASQIVIDMGRPDRLLNVIRYARFQSPILWDVCCVSVYLMGSITYLYLPLIPDLAVCRDTLKDVSPLRRLFYRVFSLGWTGTERQHKLLNRFISVMAVAIIPIAVSVHTVVSWIFAMTIQPMWHSTIFGPYFVVGAIFSGIASLLIAMAILRKVFHLEGYIKELHFRNLALLLLAMNALWFYFTFAEFITAFYGDEPHEMPIFFSKMTGKFAPWFWTMVGCMTVSFFTLAFKRTRTITGIIVASVLINVGMWFERFTIVVPTLSRPRLHYRWGLYTPTWVEVSILVGAIAAFFLFYMIFSKLFPLVSIWEVKEGREEGFEEVLERYKSYQPAIGGESSA